VEGDRSATIAWNAADWKKSPSRWWIEADESEIAQRKAAIAEQARLITEEDKAERDRANESPDPAGSGCPPGGWGRHSDAEAGRVRDSHETRDANAAQGAVAGPAGVRAKRPWKSRASTRVGGGSDRPEFYISLAAEERFGIIRLRPGRVRVVEKLTVVPVTKRRWKSRAGRDFSPAG